ncbi:hypothetical protein Q0M94_18610 (plasmid) [Deinococcus radiomollis]|uniref:hypothetical protein n=1 Tax=Deinococcus radiomollis TaxID=468916 RepID=UPI0038913FBD
MRGSSVYLFLPARLLAACGQQTVSTQPVPAPVSSLSGVCQISFQTDSIVQPTP